MKDNEWIKIYNAKDGTWDKDLLIDEANNIINCQKARIEELQEKSVLDDKLLNDRVQEAVNSVSKANQKYVDALEKAFNDKVADNDFDEIAKAGGKFE